MSTAVEVARTPYKRSVKNYLIDSRFQLKYTGFIVLLTVVLSGVLGGFVWRESQRVVAQSELVAQESRKVSDVVKMQIGKDPFYGSDPELAKAFAAASGATDGEVEKQQQALVAQQQGLLTALVVGLSLFVVAIGLLGIYITHRVAGPIYKMKLLLGQVAKGKLTFQGRLRKGDELQEFFSAFSTMVEALRERQSAEVERLSEALSLAEAQGLSGEALSQLKGVRDEMRAQLDN